jgi:kynurenine formamidase
MAEHRKNNWGRWGDDDQRGALNLITPAKVVSACQAVREGRVIALGRQIRYGMLATADRPAPTYVLTVDGGDYAAGARTFGPAKIADDFLSSALGVGTHLDGLAHVWQGDELYNGFPGNGVRSRGAKALGIHNVEGIVTRGVLLDAAALHGGALPPSHHVSVDELEQLAAQAGGVGAGDVVLLRTGWLNENPRSTKELETESPGLSLAGAQWLADHDVVLVGADNFGVEAFPPEQDGVYVPVHLLMLREMGIYLMELVDLEELAAVGAKEFLFMLAPLKVRGGINSPVNPLAII